MRLRAKKPCRYKSAASSLFPPATKLGQGNIFRSVCQEFYSQGGGMHGRGHAWHGACVMGACVARGSMVGGMHGWACVAGGHA